MLVSDNPNISRSDLKGFYLFLFSESLRHAQDIEDIRERMEEVARRCVLSGEEMQDLEKEALKYVSF
jgi:hypothetical protein